MTGPLLLIEIAVEPRSSADRGRLRSAMDRHSLGRQDIGIRIDAESGQTILSGQDERQLQAFLHALNDEVGVVAGAPQAAYRESLAKKVDVDYTHKKQSGGSGEFGRVRLTVEPGERGSGVVFIDEVKGGNIPRDYIPSVEKGIREIAATGSLIGFPIIDFTATLYDGAYHDMDSSALAFETAGRGAMREAARKAGIELLEPVMKVEVVTDSTLLDAVRASLVQRGADILQSTIDGEAAIVLATARLAAMFGFDAELDMLSGGKSESTMRFGHYALVDSNPDPDPDVPAAAALRA